MATLELYGSAHCPYTRELRDWLEFTRRDFLEYDVEADPEAHARMSFLTGGNRSVPVLVEDGRVIQTGWQGRSCIASPAVTGPAITSPVPARPIVSREETPHA